MLMNEPITSALELMPDIDTSIADLFETGDGLESMLEKIAEAARNKAAGLDVAFPHDRKQIASTAYAVSRCKSTLDELGKNYVAELKATVSRVDGKRKTAREYLDALKIEIRQPLTDFEAAEAAALQAAADAERARLERIETELYALRKAVAPDRGSQLGGLLSSNAASLSSLERCALVLADAREIAIDEAIFQERTDEARQILAQGIESLERDFELATLREQKAIADRQRAEEAAAHAREIAAREEAAMYAAAAHEREIEKLREEAQAEVDLAEAERRALASIVEPAPPPGARAEPEDRSPADRARIHAESWLFTESLSLDLVDSLAEAMMNYAEEIADEG